MRIQLFVTCMIDNLYPDIGEDVVTVLERSGAEVEVPAGQTCCGQPAFNGGFLNEAREMALHFLDVFADTEGPIVSPSGSCAAMVVHHYPELFANDEDYAAKAERVSARTRELTQFLVDDLGVTDTHAQGEGKITYHPAKTIPEKQAIYDLLS